MEDLNSMITDITSRKKGPRGGKGNGGGNGGSGPSGNGQGGGNFLVKLGRWLQWSVVLTLAALYGLWTAFYQIDPSEQGVVTRFGAFQKTSDEGPHFKLPFGIDQVYKVQVTRFQEESFGYRKDGRQISEEQARQESLMLTGDLKVAVVEWSLLYKIHDARKYLFNAVNVDKNLRDVSISVMRRVVGDKLVSDVLTIDRILIAEQAKQLTQETLDKFDMGVSLVNLSLTNVKPPPTVRPAFDDENVARQERDRMINQAKGAYNQVIPEAEGKAEKQIAEAEAFAIDSVNRAKGDAAHFSAMLEAYQRAPEITRKRLYLETMEEIFTNLERFTIVDSHVKGLLPVYNSLGKSVASAAGGTAP